MYPLTSTKVSYTVTPHSLLRRKTDLSDVVKSIDLDTSFLEIYECYINDICVKNFVVNARSGCQGALGSKLSIPLIQNDNTELLDLINSGAVVDVKVKYSTTDKCTALIWLTAEQSGDTPYVYAQLEPIHCRSMFPCFDTPAVKCTYTATIQHPLDEISLTVLPKSFGYGGIETNSVIMLTPTMLNSQFDVSGDKKFTTKETIEFNTVLIHEIIHTISSGNYVTNYNWGEMFLNEGWTVYLERKILARVLGGNGYDELTDEIIDSPSFYKTILMKSTQMMDFPPFSMRKGAFLLFYLERFVGGAKNWDPYVRYYFSTYKYQSISIWQFVNSIYEFYHSFDNSIFKKLTEEMDWNLWLLTPGLPPTPYFNNKRGAEVTDLAKLWIDKAKNETESAVSAVKANVSITSESIDSFSIPQLMLFIDSLCEFEDWAMASVTSKEIFDLYNAKFEPLFNYPEFEFRYIKWLASTKIGLDSTTERLIHFVSTIGRMKFVRPLYVTLAKINKDLAVETYERLKGFYSNVCAEMVKKDLGI
ncbi:unnamed protein product [Hanseniaspora opuntiae]